MVLPRFGHLPRRALVVAFVVMVLLAAVPAVAFAGGGNSNSAKLCQKGGWTGLQGDTGSFLSQDACVSYLAKGGTLFHPQVTATVFDCAGDRDSIYQFEVTGFHANSAMTWAQDTGFTDTYGSTDANGAITGSAILYDFGPGPDGMTAMDSHGVHAHVTLPASPCG
jgi:hypothetical protein